MALITKFEERPAARAGWRTTVTCGWKIARTRDGNIISLETYGSDVRKLQGKPSQSIQIDVDAARQLSALIDRAFPQLRR